MILNNKKNKGKFKIKLKVVKRLYFYKILREGNGSQATREKIDDGAGLLGRKRQLCGWLENIAGCT